MDDFFANKHGSLHKENLFYPFASWEDWQLGSWLLRSGLSMVAINKFLSLDLVSYHFHITKSQLIRLDPWLDQDTLDLIPVCKATTPTYRDVAIWAVLEVSPSASISPNKMHCHTLLSWSHWMPSGIAQPPTFWTASLFRSSQGLVNGHSVGPCLCMTTGSQAITLGNGRYMEFRDSFFPKFLHPASSGHVTCRLHAIRHYIVLQQDQYFRHVWKSDGAPVTHQPSQHQSWDSQ